MQSLQHRRTRHFACLPPSMFRTASDPAEGTPSVPCPSPHPAPCYPAHPTPRPRTLMFVAKFYDGQVPTPHPEKGQKEVAELGALVEAKVRS